MSRRATLFLITLAAAAGMIGLGLYAGGKPSDPPLEIDPASLELGEVWLDADYQQQLTLRNVSSRSVTISEFDTSCACTRIEPASLIIAPGKSQAINVRINFLKLIDKADQDRWPASVRFRARVEEDRNPSWRVAVEIKSPVTKLPFYGRDHLRLRRNESPRELTYLIEAAHGAEFSEIIPKTSFVKCRAARSNSGALVGTLEIDPAKMEEGPFLASAELRFKNAEGNPLPSIPWEVPFWVQPSVELDPSVLLMGAQLRQRVILRSLAQEGFKIVAIDQVDGLTAQLLPAEGNRLDHQILEIQAIPTKSASALVPLHLVVEHDNSHLREPLTLLVQRPVRMLIADEIESP